MGEKQIPVQYQGEPWPSTVEINEFYRVKAQVIPNSAVLDGRVAYMRNDTNIAVITDSPEQDALAHLQISADNGMLFAPYAILANPDALIDSRFSNQESKAGEAVWKEIITAINSVTEPDKAVMYEHPKLGPTEVDCGLAYDAMFIEGLTQHYSRQVNPQAEQTFSFSPELVKILAASMKECYDGDDEKPHPGIAAVAGLYDGQAYKTQTRISER